MPAGQQRQPEVPPQWLMIDDFTPGCYDFTNTLVSSIVEAPKGAADPNNTWCCAALPSGGLSPLPALTTTYNASDVPASQEVFVVGFTVNPALADNHTELIYLLEWDTGTNHLFVGNSYVIDTAVNTSFVELTSASSGPSLFGAPYPFWTRMASAAEGPSVPGYIVCVFPTAAGGAPGHVYVYPSPEAPTSFGVLDLIDDTPVTGQTFGYDNRVVVLSGITYSYPTGGGVATNEQINFTDPPNSETLGVQNTVLVAENPFGYSSWGSINAGELFLVKKQVGGVLVTGDILNPGSVTNLPGVQPGGDFVGRAASAEVGFFYCSEGRGAWVWTGGNEASKISPQLADNFYDCFTGVIDSNNYGFFCQWAWSDYVAFSNNWLYNARTGGWWTLFPRTGTTAPYLAPQTFFHYAPGPHGYQLYAAVLSIPSGAGSPVPFAYLFDATVAAPHWQWQSVPMRLVAHGDQLANIRKVTVRASCPNAGSTISVALIDSGTGTVYSYEESAVAIGTSVTLLTFNVAGLGLSDFQIRLNGDQLTSGHAAPTVHGIGIEWEPAAHVAPQGTDV